MSSTAMPRFARSASSSSRICACTVTSSAVVGSSAMSSSGSRGERDGDHHALAHAAAQLVRVLVEPALGRRHAHLLEQRDARRSRASRAVSLPVGAHRLGDLVAGGEAPG